jgi:microcin C transport system permease protein
MPPYSQGEGWAIDTWWAKPHRARQPGLDAQAELGRGADGSYILKRLLLMLPDPAGVLLITFIVTQFVPGGPVEQYLAEARAGPAAGAEGGTFSYRGGQGVDPKKLEQIKALYGFDKPPHERFCRCWASTPASTWASSFFQNKAVSAADRGKAAGVHQPGLWTFFISYLIAVPLGVAKAVRAGTASTW